MSKPSLPVPTSFQVSNGGNQNGEKKAGYFNYELEPGFTVRLRQDIDPAMDPKNLKRIISNRVSAQRSRWKKHQYVEYLEKKAKELQVSVKRSQVEMLSELNQCLEIENRELEECIFASLQRSISAQVKIEALIAERERLEKEIARSI